MPAHDSERPGWISESNYLSPIETPSGYLARGEMITLYCSAAPRCTHMRTVNMQALIDRGWGNVPISAFRERWRCEECGQPCPQMQRGTPGEPFRPGQGRRGRGGEGV